MDFIDRIRDLAARIPKQVEHIQTEEATKNAFIMPFIDALGYNVFDPTEVTPELHADVGLKKGEKVDYAILKDGKPTILFECKWHGTDLRKEHASQLYRYFSVTEARFAVLTNGIQYRFYTDLEAPNKMDSKPFFEFDILAMRDQDVEELKKFSKSAFDIDNILTTASELKYTREIKRLIADQMQEPSEEFIKFFASQVYSGRMTQSVKEQFSQTVRRALKQFVNDQVNERLKTALGAEVNLTVEQEQVATITEVAAPEPEKPEAKIVTTIDEMEAYHIVRAILREIVDVKRVVIRDKQTYCGILFDDNNRKPICRLWFNGSQRYVSLFDGADRSEEKLPISDIDDLYTFADRLKATVQFYL